MPLTAPVYVRRLLHLAFLHFPEVFFAICSSNFIPGFGAGNLKISCQCCLTVRYYEKFSCIFYVLVLVYNVV